MPFRIPATRNLVSFALISAGLCIFFSSDLYLFWPRQFDAPVDNRMDLIGLLLNILAIITISLNKSDWLPVRKLAMAYLSFGVLVFSVILVERSLPLASFQEFLYISYSSFLQRWGAIPPLAVFVFIQCSDGGSKFGRTLARLLFITVFFYLSFYLHYALTDPEAGFRDDSDTLFSSFTALLLWLFAAILTFGPSEDTHNKQPQTV